MTTLKPDTQTDGRKIIFVDPARESYLQLCLIKYQNGEYSTHIFNKQDGGFYHGSSYRDRTEATLAYFDRVRQEQHPCLR